MTKRKLGLISVGQSPRSDDVATLLGEQFQVLEYGLLDDYTHQEVEELFSPGPKEVVLRPRMRQGPPTRVAARHIGRLLQEAIPRLEEQDCELILVYGQGIYPPLRHRVPLLEPYKLIRGVLAALCGGQTVGIVVPDPQMIASLPEEFPELALRGFSANAYHTDKALLRAEFAAFDGDGVDLWFLNCGSFTAEDKNLLRELTGKPVILSRSITDKIILELA